VRRALFLDFDGVLHPTVKGALDGGDGAAVHTTQFGWLPTLAVPLNPHPDVVIVGHPTWRYTHGLEELQCVLGALVGRVVGAKPRGPRYESIRRWPPLNRAFASHRILDDDAREFPQLLPAEPIVCGLSTGVSAPDVQARIRAWLGGLPRPGTSRGKR
jgi:hypothetical protein